MTDELAGAEPVLTRRRLVALGVLVALVLAGLVGDRWAANREVARLDAAVAAAEVGVVHSRDRLEGLIEYESALLFRPDITAELQAALLSTLAADAARSIPRIEQARAAVAAVRVLPWHGTNNAARAAYLQRIEVWLTHLRRIATSPVTALRSQPAVGEARTAARGALQAAGITLP